MQFKPGYEPLTSLLLHPGVVLKSDNELTCTTPPGSGGPVTVQLGTGSTRLRATKLVGCLPTCSALEKRFSRSALRSPRPRQAPLGLSPSHALKASIFTMPMLGADKWLCPALAGVGHAARWPDSPSRLASGVCAQEGAAGAERAHSQGSIHRTDHFV
eukprot:scaffold8535_cov43-Prasinocladus_malaysianus.AAC.3